VNVQVEDDLPRCCPVSLKQVDPVRVEDFHEPSAHVVNSWADVDQRLPPAVRHDVRYMRARDHQRMALSQWRQIQKGDCGVVFVNQICGRRARRDLAKDA